MNDKIQKWSWIAIFLVALLQLALGAFWLGQNRLWSGQEIMLVSGQIGQVFNQHGLAGLADAFSIINYYPPGYDLLVGFLHYLFGLSTFNPMLINLFFITIAAFATLGIGRRISGDYLGLVSALLFLSYPLIFFVVWTPNREIAMTAPVALAIYALLGSGNFTKKRMTALFAFSFVVGMYIKWTFSLYLLFPMIYYFGRELYANIRSDDADTVLFIQKRQWQNIGMVTAVVFVFLAPWYLGVFDWKRMGAQPGGHALGTFDWGFVLGYGKEFFFKFPYLLFWPALPFALIGKNKSSARFLLVWLITDYILFTIIPHRVATTKIEIRYFAPFLPAMALLTTQGVQTFKAAWPKVVFPILLIGLLAWQVADFFIIHPAFVDNTADVVRYEKEPCDGLSDQAFAKLQTAISEKVGNLKTDHLPWVAVHPFNGRGFYFRGRSPGKLFYGNEPVCMGSMVKTVNGAKAGWYFIGFDLINNDMYYPDFSNIDLIVLDEALWSLPKEDLLDEISQTVDGIEAPFAGHEDDPGYMDRIRQEFAITARIEMDGHPAALLLKRKAPGDEEMASTHLATRSSSCKNPYCITENEKPGVNWACAKAETCVADYMRFIKIAKKFGNPISKEELDNRLETIAKNKAKIIHGQIPTAPLRKKLIEAMNIGFLLQDINKRPLTVTLVGESETEKYRQRTYLFTDPYVGTFRALLLLPKTSGPHPAVIAVHGHVEEAEDFRDNYYGKEFPGHGYAILMPTMRAMGCAWPEDQVTRALLQNGFTFMAIRSYETLLCLRFLQFLPEIDNDRIGLLGHSGGSVSNNLTIRIAPGFAAFVSDCFRIYFDGDPYPVRLIDEAAPTIYPYHKLVNDLSTCPVPALEVGYGFPEGPDEVFAFLDKVLK